MIGYALRILSSKGRIYLSLNEEDNIFITTDRKVIEEYQDRVPCSVIVRFRKRKPK